MRARWSLLESSMAMIVFVVTLAAARGQQCDDLNACTTNDMCAEEECMGTPVTGGSCDDFDDCTVNDRCVPVTELEPDGCMGDPAPVGTACQGGCGTCQSFSPIPIPGIPLFCRANPGANGQPCDSGFGNPCADDRCQVQAMDFVFCFPQFRECPDTDGNPCTDACDFETGECVVDAPRCIPVCQQCNPSTGGCEPANLGAACDDFNECSAQSRCELVGDFSLCMPGEPTVFTPTPPGVATATPTVTVPGVNTPTQTVVIGTPTASPTQGRCVGDCDDDNQVRVNELVLGTNIALDLADLSQCPEFDDDNDGSAEVNELILGVNAALNGCVAAAAAF